MFVVLFAASVGDQELKDIIGIDLRTTWSCVAIYQKGKAEVIPNSAGFRITPSVVSFNGSEYLVGDAAKQKLGSPRMLPQATTIPRRS
jgi:heat shock protein 5